MKLKFIHTVEKERISTFPFYYFKLNNIKYHKI